MKLTEEINTKLSVIMIFSIFFILIVFVSIINEFSRTGNLKRSLCVSYITQSKLTCKLAGCGWMMMGGIPEIIPKPKCVYIDGSPQGFIE